MQFPSPASTYSRTTVALIYFAALNLVPFAFVCLYLGTLEVTKWVIPDGRANSASRALTLAVAVLSLTGIVASFLKIIAWARANALRRIGIASGYHAALARQYFPSKRRQAGLINSLSVEDLVAAYHHPNHTAAARALIQQRLQELGSAKDLSNEYLPPKDRMTLRSPIAGIADIAMYRQRCKTREAFFGVFRWLFLLVVVPVINLLLIIFLPSLPFLAGRRRAARVLLLRPFGEAQMTRALKRVVVTKLGRIGNVFTLSDQNYKPNYVADGAIRLLGIAAFPAYPFFRLSHRLASVRDERTFNTFALALEKPWRLSYKTFLNGGQALNIRTTDRWWKRCIDLLMNSSDVIVMDVSKVSTGSAWEIAEIARRGLIPITIFIVQERYKEQGERILRSLIADSDAFQLHVYGDDGKFADVTAFDASLSSTLETALVPSIAPTPATCSPRQLTAHAKVIVAVAAIGLFSLVAFRVYQHFTENPVARLLREMEESERTKSADAVQARASNAIAWKLFTGVVLKGEAQGALRDALAHSDRALALQPLDVNARDTRGQIYLALDRVDDALVDLEFAISMGGNYTGTYFARGRCREMKGDRNAAIADYRRALEADADDDYAKHAREQASKRLAALGVRGPEPGRRK